MRTSQASKILKLLDRLNAELELLNKVINKQRATPAAIPIRVERFKFKK